MALALYLAAALFCLWLAARTVAPLSRGAAIVLLLLPLLFTGRALLTGGVYAPVDLPYANEPLRSMRAPLGVPPPQDGALTDLFAQMIPARAALKASLRNGEWPLWNPYILGGSILAGAAQPAVYSPVTLLACLLPLGASFTFSASMTLFLAGLGAFLFARELGCREAAALFAACGWMYAMPVAFFLLWPVSASWIWLPLVFLAARRCVHQPGARSAALLTAVLSLLLLAGHPESAMHIVYVGGAYGLFELLTMRRNALRAMAWVMGAGVVALLLCAIYVLPIVEAAPQTMEHEFRVQAWSKLPHGVSNSEALARIVTDLFPFLHGREWTAYGLRYIPLDSAGAGSIILAAALYAVWRIRSRETWFFGGLALFGLLMRAAWAPLFNLLQRVLPLWDISINERIGYAGALALVILAALGVERALETRDRAFGFTLAAVLAVLAAGAIVIQRAHLVVDVLPPFGAYRLAAESGCLALAALAALARPQPRLLAAALLGILAMQRAMSEGDIYPTLPARAAYPPIPLFAPLRSVREPFRIAAVGHMLIPGTSTPYGLEDVRGYEALTFSRYKSTYELWCVHQPIWFNRVDDLTRPFLSLLNVRYALTDPKAPLPEGWTTVAEQRGARLVENSRVLPRAFVPERVVFGSTWDGMITAMRNERDFRERAWIEAPLPSHERDNRAGRIVSVSRAPNGLLIRADMKEDGWVVVSEPAWKGWRAYIDGRRVQHHFADIAFLAVSVPAGAHTLRLTYYPESFALGRLISLATLVTLGALGVTIGVRRRRAARL
jgi:hypothetical protein